MTGVAEIREADAPPETAAIYDQIKQASGLPLVNLIWRRFAALPGVLPWAWEAVGPFVRSTSMEAACQRLSADIKLPPSSDFDWREAGLNPQESTRVFAIIEAYTRGNLTNLLALTALRLRLEQPQVPSGRLLPAAAMRPVLGVIDPLPSLASLSPEVAAMVRTLAACHDGPADIIPSLYLHFAHWPRLLEVLPRALSTLYAPGVLEIMRDATRRTTEVEVAMLLPASLPPPTGTEYAVNAAIGHFTTRAIPDLLLVCLALSRSTVLGRN